MPLGLLPGCGSRGPPWFWFHSGSCWVNRPDFAVGLGQGRVGAAAAAEVAQELLDVRVAARG